MSSRPLHHIPVHGVSLEAAMDVTSQIPVVEGGPA